MKTIYAASLACSLLLVTSPVFARPMWPAVVAVSEKKEKKVIPPEELFLSKLSDYHRKRFASLSPEQKRAALRYFTSDEIEPDRAIEQVTREVYTIR
jgi:hypothetical protein